MIAQNSVIDDAGVSAARSTAARETNATSLRKKGTRKTVSILLSGSGVSRGGILRWQGGKVTKWQGDKGTRLQRFNVEKRNHLFMSLCHFLTPTYPFKCGNNSLNAADDEERISS